MEERQPDGVIERQRYGDREMEVEGQAGRYIERGRVRKSWEQLEMWDSGTNVKSKHLYISCDQLGPILF